MERRLTAIIAADVVDYSRLMGEDEARTLKSLKQFRTELFEPLVIEYRGNVVKRMGDGWLVEFPSITDATDCVIDIQKRLVGHDVITLRIGVHLGDVTFDDEDIFGDGVNVAARLEALSAPGGVLISDTAYQSLDGKAIQQFNGGESMQLKNIARSVQVWEWRDGPAKGDANSANKAVPVSQTPSIAVLPFSNLSNDAEQDFLADGISEDIITELSRFPDLLVIARSSTFLYKGQGKDAKEIGRELGVSYVLEGSVRKGGQRVRITVQLINGNTGEQIWAERYDRQIDDIFELQDEITQNVVASVPERVETAEVRRVKRSKTADMSAYGYLIRGKQHHHKSTKDDNAEALRLLDKAIELDPEYAPAYAWKACTLGQSLGFARPEEMQSIIEENLKNVHKGLSLDENDVECHRILCEFGMYNAEWEVASRHHEKAFKLNPNDPRIIAQRGELQTMLGSASEGADWVRKAMQLDPYCADNRAHLLARALFSAGQYEEAITAYNQISKPNAEHLADMAGCYAKLEQRELAGSYAAKVLVLKSEFTITEYLASRRFKEQGDMGQLREALISANLPQ